jgi:hypothetical protein
VFKRASALLIINSSGVKEGVSPLIIISSLPLKGGTQGG